MSFDIFMATRAAPTAQRASGLRNVWAVNSRAKWSRHGFTNQSRCVDSTTGSAFTRSLAGLVREAIRRRVAVAPAAFSRAIADWV